MKMIGKLVYIDEDDAYYRDREFLIGTLWELVDTNVWDNNGCVYGQVAFAGTVPLAYASNDSNIGKVEWNIGEMNTFHAVKFEILENTGE